eukprot:symbB.v1.2.020542.t1/scaffold1725.1/size121579/7
MMYVEREKGLERVVKQMCAKHLLETGKEWGKLVAGNQSENAYLVRTWPEFAALRDIMFFWKYFLCTDLRAAYLAWNVANENEVFGPPTNRGAIFQVSAFGQDHVLKTNEPNYRPKPSASGHRYASAALASKYTGRAVVRTEDDLLYLRSLPTFEDRLRPSDAEALLSFLTVPYIRMPLMLSFFTSADRVNCLFSDTLRSILHAVVLEPGKFLMPGRWHDCPQMVPAASAAEAELLATPFGQLIIGRSLYCLKLPCRAFPAAAFVVAMASDLVGKAAPDFEIELEDGSKKKLSEFLAEGKPVVIDFYANF